ncbi:hypothetical protein ACUXZZ_20485 [Streptomyces graminifolii]|uniref:hypothetical protein n=1 Tax=Streptomyces graminifolii TaxID=1266771 RepID=UPI004058119B
MTQRNPIAPGRRLIATGMIRRTPDRTLKLVATEAGTTGSIAKHDRVAELHRLANEDYAKGESQRASANDPGLYTAFTPVPEPSDLATAVAIAQQLLDSDDIVPVREALRLVLRALGAAPEVTR